MTQTRTRAFALFLSSSIFVVAIVTITIISQTPFGTIYQTLTGQAADPSSQNAIPWLGDAASTRSQTVALTLTGLTKPELDVQVAEKEGALYIVLTMEDPTATEARLTLPTNWHLEETTYVPMRTVAAYPAGEQTTLFIPLPEHKVEMRFSATEPFDAISLTHDAESPALFTFTHLDVATGESQQKVLVVEKARMMRL